MTVSINEQVYRAVESGINTAPAICKHLLMERNTVTRVLVKLKLRGWIAKIGVIERKNGRSSDIYAVTDQKAKFRQTTLADVDFEDDPSDELEAYLLPRKKTYYSNVSFIFHAGAK